VKKEQENASVSNKEGDPDLNEEHNDGDNNMDVANENTSESNKDGDPDPNDNKYGDSPTQGSIRTKVFK
jgi:hypothetical protein